MNTAATTPETKTVYIGKGRYGTNHKGHAIATHTPAQRPTPGQGAYVYTVTVTHLDGTETTIPMPIEAAHAEAAAVQEWEAHNTPEETPAAVEEPTAAPAPAVTYVGAGAWEVEGRGIIVQGITQAWYARDTNGDRVTIKGNMEWGGPQRPAEIALMVDWA